MAIMLFKLRGVEEDEAEGLRQALRREYIDFYETPADRWGVSMPAIWLKDEAQLQQAQTVVTQYQQLRSAQFKNEYESRKKAGTLETFVSRFKNRPVTVVLYIILLVVVIYFVTIPFIHFAK